MCCSGPIHIIQGRQPGNRPPGLRADTPLPAQEEGFALYGLLRQSRCSGWIPRGRVQKLFSLRQRADAHRTGGTEGANGPRTLTLPAVPPPFAVGFRKLWKMGSST
eukprot:CAMPEP_0182839532 /NCGR_PEP_ID=MMETSP0006_2-20121128/23915_1 /TAXON_ID=97485 /ORGANISM="Prymnesium parvum, Strain Texoma1" /LENGTH=105 /DNA_ID=CAMNT_0024968685 /DNA_START=219 /DNA_END=539 /DNA_ORIENTATION=-